MVQIASFFYFEYNLNMENLSIYNLIVITKGVNNDFYVTTFNCSAEDANELAPSFLEYAKSITVKKAN